MKKRSLLLGLLILTGCTSPQAEAPAKEPILADSPVLSRPELIRSLDNLSQNSSSAEVLLVFNALLARTAQSYPDGLQINSYAYDRRPILQDEKLIEASFQIDSIHSSWIQGLSLYQVSRYTSRADFGQDDNVVLSRIDLQADTEVVCTPRSGQSLSDDEPVVRIDTIDISPLSIPGQFDQSRYHQILQNRQLQYLAGSLGDYYSISPQQDPGLYSFSLEQDEGGYIFHIELESIALYNSQAKELDPQRNRLEGKELENFATDSINIDVYLDEEGVITSMETRIVNSFIENSQTYQISEEQQLFLQEAPQQALSSVVTFFEEVDDGTLAVGQSFPLKVPVAARQ